MTMSSGYFNLTKSQFINTRITNIDPIEVNTAQAIDAPRNITSRLAESE